MKKIIKFSLLSALAIAAFINPLKAQDAKAELAAYVKKFQDAYNKKDDKGLKEMYTKDATRTTMDGKIQNGNEAIGAWFADYLKNNKVTLALKLDKVTEKDGVTEITGTFHVTGTSAKGEKIDTKGGFTNTMVKDNGHWKISKSVLIAL
ncbi:MAG: nuclear transport factor 2 family protein [Ferruginibacter sp.]